MASTALVSLFALSFWIVGVSTTAYLTVAIAAGLVLLSVAVRFLKSPTVRNAWIGYRISGPYLAAILLGVIADRLLFRS